MLNNVFVATFHHPKLVKTLTIIFSQLVALFSEDPIMAKALKYMSHGYQRELTYRHDDYSFSAFGNSDDSGSTWLTAFVVRTFHQAMEFLEALNEDNIRPSLNWLVQLQGRDGSFRKVHTEYVINYAKVAIP